MTPETVHREAIRTARELCSSGAGTVMDNLLRLIQPAQLQAFLHWLPSGSGVFPLVQAEQIASAKPLPKKPAGLSQPCLVVEIVGRDEPVVAMADPWDHAASKKIAASLGRLPALAAATTAILNAHDGRLQPQSQSIGSSVAATNGPGGVVVDFVDSALRAAYAGGASDVHFECDRVGVTVKFRLDGVMQTFTRMDNAARAEEVVSRIKVLAQLDITERRIPQDGRFRFEFDSAAIDLRVSIMPSVFGEDAVLRLLDKAQLRGGRSGISLEQLGFDAGLSKALRKLADLPHGMLLVTGPTGSGKTTTVYAVLSEVSRGDEKVITIEDPVEYELPGVLQIPVNDRKGLTFAKGLRSILRHDPDRILVGEIRDAETAEIAIQSALTGHQVFTTVHANNIFDVVGRFKHFGLDMFGFMSSLNGLVVQRLIRTVCQECSGSREPDAEEQDVLKRYLQDPCRLAVAKGCQACHGSGYKGRTVIAQLHIVDDRLRDMVTSGASLSELREHAAHIGRSTLQGEAAKLLALGCTTYEEIRRVVGWE